MIKKVRRMLHLNSQSDYVDYGLFRLPPAGMRKCTEEFSDDDYFMASATAEVERLIDDFGISSESTLLDVGCGPGRLALGLLSTLGMIHQYIGVDVSNDSIEWCKRNIESFYPQMRFVHLNVYNERYHPNGTVRLRNESFRFPFDDGKFDAIYLYSVFSHMVAEDVNLYLKEFRRVICSTGKVLLTAYIEDDVPDFEINPLGYRDQYSGPLHRVRYAKRFFEKMVLENGLRIIRYDNAAEHDQQSLIYLAAR